MLGDAVAAECHGAVCSDRFPKKARAGIGIFIARKYGDTLEDTIVKLEYDLYYIKNLAPSLDAYIIFHTLKVMLLSRGAQ